jgi:thymidine kinase
MAIENYQHIKPGKFEIFCGPMYSGKTDALEYRLDPLKHIPNCRFIFIQPKIDTRVERASSFETTFIDENNPDDIFNYINPIPQVIGIEEIQQFNKRLVKIIRVLSNNGVNIVGAGLDLDFRGEVYGIMGELLAMADYVTKCRKSICKYHNCGQIATRTQRLLFGKPAPYDDILRSTEGSRAGETYEPRCLKHHFVPGINCHVKDFE